MASDRDEMRTVEMATMKDEGLLKGQLRRGYYSVLI